MWQSGVGSKFPIHRISKEEGKANNKRITYLEFTQYR
jgi:hypothetical protein